MTAPDLIVGHGVMGRLLARITLALGLPAPTVWETQPVRREGATGYSVIHPDEGARCAVARRPDHAHAEPRPRARGL